MRVPGLSVQHLQGCLKNNDACKFVRDFVIEPLNNPGGVRGAPPRVAEGVGWGRSPPTDRDKPSCSNPSFVYPSFKTALN